MTSEELRIGVWITDTYADGSDFVTQADIAQMEYPHNCKGIKLTESWLINLGFNKGLSLVCERRYYRKGFPFMIFEYADRIIIEMNAAFKVTLLYVHQLQNLYFALTGEELTLQS